MQDMGGRTNEAGFIGRVGRAGIGKYWDGGAAGMGGVLAGKTVSSSRVCASVWEVLRGRLGGKAGSGTSDTF